MNDMTLDQTMSMDDLLDSTLDDLADMPEFKPWEPGSYKVSIKWDYSKYATEKTISVTMKHVETLELNTPDAVPPTVGDECKLTFFLTKADKVDPRIKLKNEFGEGAWKMFLFALAPSFPGTKKEIMDASNGAEVGVVTKLRADKRDPKDVKYYTEVTAVYMG